MPESETKLTPIEQAKRHLSLTESGLSRDQELAKVLASPSPFPEVYARFDPTRVDGIPRFRRIRRIDRVESILAKRETVLRERMEELGVRIQALNTIKVPVPSTEEPIKEVKLFKDVEVVFLAFALQNKSSAIKRAGIKVPNAELLDNLIRQHPDIDLEHYPEDYLQDCLQEALAKMAAAGAEKLTGGQKPVISVDTEILLDSLTSGLTNNRDWDEHIQKLHRILANPDVEVVEDNEPKPNLSWIEKQRLEMKLNARKILQQIQDKLGERTSFYLYELSVLGINPVNYKLATAKSINLARSKDSKKSSLNKGEVSIQEAALVLVLPDNFRNLTNHHQGTSRGVWKSIIDLAWQELQKEKEIARK